MHVDVHSSSQFSSNTKDQTRKEISVMATTPQWIMIGGEGPESYNKHSSYQVYL